MLAVRQADVGGDRSEVGPQDLAVAVRQRDLYVQVVQEGVGPGPRTVQEAGAVMLVRFPHEHQDLIDRFDRAGDVLIEGTCEVGGVFDRALLRCLVIVPEIEPDPDP
jgi:hypothetical protein